MLPDFIYMETGGSPLMSLTVWFVGGIVAFFGSICYAELATSINVSGTAVFFSVFLLHCGHWSYHIFSIKKTLF